MRFEIRLASTQKAVFFVLTVLVFLLALWAMLSIANVSAQAQSTSPDPDQEISVAVGCDRPSDKVIPAAWQSMVPTSPLFNAVLADEARAKILSATTPSEKYPSGSCATSVVCDRRRKTPGLVKERAFELDQAELESVREE